MTENPYKTPQHATLPTGGYQQRYGSVRNLSGLATFSKVMLVLNVVFAVAFMFYMFSSQYDQVIEDARQGVIGESMQVLITFGGVGLVIFVLTVVAICMWTYRAMANTWAIASVQPSNTAGWAVGWYFIPIAHLWKPYGAMCEIWNGVYGYSKSRALLFSWWMAWIVSTVLSRISSRMELTDDTMVLDLAESILSIFAAVLLIKIIKDITVRQNEKVISGR